MTGRDAALKALSAWRQRGAFSADAVISASEKAELDQRELAFASRIVFGVIQNLTLIDFYIFSFSSIKQGKVEPRVLDIMRVAAYQLLFMDRVPASAAVNEAVKQTRRFSNKQAVGYVNAVLRRIALTKESLPQITGDPCHVLSVKYSHPEWLTKRFIDILGEEKAEALLRTDNDIVPSYLQTNTLKLTAEEAYKRLTAEDGGSVKHQWLDGCFLTLGSVEKLSVFNDGDVYVQDPAARMSVIAAGIKPGMRVLDACSAPGGKSFAAAMEMHGEGQIVSADVHDNKLSRLEDGASRLGIDIIDTLCMDAREPYGKLKESFDVVIADVPCSGFGVIRKKPEIRFRSEADTAAIPEIQADIIRNISKCVKPGGVLMYSTCTVLPEENENIISGFLAENSDFETEAFTLPGPCGECADGMITLWPHKYDTDGFFICKLRKKI